MAIAGGYAVANAWNPTGWIVGGIVIIGGIYIGTELSKESQRVSSDSIALPMPSKPTLVDKWQREIGKIVNEAAVIKAKTQNNKKKFFEINMSKLPVTGKMIVIIGKPITEAKAVQRLRKKQSTITWFGYNARRIANKAGNGKKLLQHDTVNTTKKDVYIPKFKHYHPYANPAHSFYIA